MKRKRKPICPTCRQDLTHPPRDGESKKDCPQCGQGLLHANSKTTSIVIKRPQKRYETAQAIEAEIDKVTDNQRQNSEFASILDNKVDVLTEQIRSVQFVNEAKREQVRRERDRLLDLADKAREKNPEYVRKLNRLKHTLAAFNTVTMPFLEDPSVTLQK